MSDRVLIDLFNARDEAAIEETARIYGARLRAIALAVTGDESAADECVNDALLRAWEHIPPADPEGRLFAYLARIVRGIAIDRLRRGRSLKRGAVVVELTDELRECLPSGESVEDAALANELSDIINGFVRELPREKQLIFIRRYWYFDSIAAVAGSLGLSQSKVKTELYRMRIKLKSRLEGKGYTV